MTFAMTWFSYIFPNTGEHQLRFIFVVFANRILALITATFAVGLSLKNTEIQVMGCVMACLLVVAWAAVFIIMIRAVLAKDILWPQRQEDRDEGGWTSTINDPTSSEPKSDRSQRLTNDESLNQRHTVDANESKEGSDESDFGKESKHEGDDRASEPEQQAMNNLINRPLRHSPRDTIDDMV